MRKPAVCAIAATFAIALGALPASSAAAVTARGESCTTDIGSGFASAKTLERLNTKMDSFGAPRATGNEAHRRFLDWLETKLRAVDGARVSEIPYEIRRWDEQRTALSVAGTELPVAAVVPYSKPTGPDGTTAPLAYVPEGEEISAANSAGKIVVRETPPGAVPYAAFTPALLGIDSYDPDGLLTSGGDYRREFLAPVRGELEAAEAAGAAGILFLRPLPRRHLKGFYAPYEGVQWKLPGAFLGAGQSARVRAALEADPEAAATLTVEARRKRVQTRTLLATIQGQSPEKLVVDSHTDGTNAVEDNGPIAMLAWARRLAQMPLACRPKTVQFAFVTGHFYQHLEGPGKPRDGGAERIAERLDRQYDSGKVGAVMVVEHLGAYRYDFADNDHGPGEKLVRTDEHELSLLPVTDSVPLRDATAAMIKRRKLNPTAMLWGADLPDESHVPYFCSFGGEGSPYERHLLPTVATIAAPNILFSPAFGVEGIDFPYMRRQALGYLELLQEMGRMTREELAGNVIELREMRDAGYPTCPAN